MDTVQTARWSLLSHHGQVMVEIARRPDVRMREIAERLGLSERTIQNLVNDLVAEGCVTRIREGRRNRYVVRGDLPVRG